MLLKNADSACLGMGMSLDPEALTTLVTKLRQAGTKFYSMHQPSSSDFEEISDSGIIVTPHIGEIQTAFGREPDQPRRK